MAQKYDYLTPQERLAMLRPRLADAERRVFNMELDAIATGPNVVPPQTAQLTSELEALKALETELEAEIAGPTSSTKSNKKG